MVVYLDGQHDTIFRCCQFGAHLWHASLVQPVQIAVTKAGLAVFDEEASSAILSVQVIANTTLAVERSRAATSGYSNISNHFQVLFFFI